MFLEHNVMGRKKRAPIGVILYLLNITGIVGNSIVLHVFRTRFNDSLNYRTFVLFLAMADLNICIAHLMKEMNRMTYVYNQFEYNRLISHYLCTGGHYIGNAVGIASFLIIIFINFERYRKICTPFKPQITVRISRIMCVCSLLLSFVITVPIGLIYGRRDVAVDGINATRCAMKNEYDRVMLPFLYHILIFVFAFSGFIAVVIFQLKIRGALVKKNNSKKKMKNMHIAHVPKSGNPQTKIEDGKNDKQDKSKKKKESAEDEEERRNRRIAITFAVVSLFLIISFFTHLLYAFILSMERYLFPRNEISDTLDIQQEYIPDAIIINGILNPLIYFFTDAQFKQELKKMCRRGV
jgi:NADH:ubiquinone oxidoreductase subunit 3 (subunit A)